MEAAVCVALYDAFGDLVYRAVHNIDKPYGLIFRIHLEGDRSLIRTVHNIGLCPISHKLTALVLKSADSYLAALKISAEVSSRLAGNEDCGKLVKVGILREYRCDIPFAS